MKTTTHIALILTAALAAHTYGGDAKVTLDSNDGSSAFLVRDAASNEIARVSSDGKVGIGTNAPAYTLDVLGDINLTGALRTNGVAWTPLSSFTELDPLFGVSVAAGIVNADLVNWNTAFGWGNHATAGYLTAYTETDPVFAASAAAGIGAPQVGNWNTAFGWGNHALAGYLTTYTETDPVFAASAAAGIGAPQVANWNSAFGWGNHALAGYLTAYTETDPVFTASVAAGISASNTNAWNVKLDGSGTANTVPKFSADGTLGDSAIVSDASGKVGIGAASPTHQLNIVGPSAATGTGILKLSTPGVRQGETNSLSLYSTFNGTGDNTPRRTADILAGFDKFIWGSEYLALGVGVNGAYNDGGNVTSEKLRIQANGNVGIGTNAPAYKLHVAGSLNATAITINGTPVASSTDTYWSTAGSGAIQYSGGNVGVGTATPAASAALEVTASDKGMLVPRLTQAQRNAIGAPATGLLIYQTDNTPGFYFYSGSVWSSISAGPGAVTSVAATAPLASSGGTTPTLSLPAATASANGYLSSTDWTTFNNKASAGANSTITSLTGLTTDLAVTYGGTGASTLTGVVHGNGTAALTASAVALASEVSGTLPVANGGTGASDAAGARSNLGLTSAATQQFSTQNIASTLVQRDASGNFTAGTITATLSGTATKASNLVGGNNSTFYGAMPYQWGVDATGWVTPNTTTTKKFLSMTGSGVNGATPVWDTFSGAAAGANSDITSLSGLTTDITVAQGGTGASTASAARTNLGLGTAATYPASANNVAGNVVVRDASGDVGVHTVFASGNVSVSSNLTVNGTTIVPILDYAMVAKTSQPSAATGTDISWGTPYLRGNMTMNASRFLLKAGKTYELECALKFYSWSSPGGATFAWVDTSNALVGDVNVIGYVYPVTYTSGDSLQPVAKAVFTPSVDTYVKVRMQSVTGTVTIEGAGSYATVKQLQ